jgi:hypothetical protein
MWAAIVPAAEGGEDEEGAAAPFVVEVSITRRRKVNWRMNRYEQADESSVRGRGSTFESLPFECTLDI